MLFGVELAARGHHIDYILQSEAACARRTVQEWSGGHVWVGATDLGTSRLARLHKHLLGIGNDLRLFGRLWRGQYDLLLVKDKFIAGALGLIAARLSGKRYVYWLSYPFAEESLLKAREGTARYPVFYRVRGWVFHALLYRWLLPAADHVFVQSERMLTDVAAKGISAQKMTAVPMGIQPERFQMQASAGARQWLPAGVPCVLYLGTLNKVRHLDFLVRVLARVREQVPAAMLCIVGGGDDPSEERLLTDEADRLGVREALLMLGQLPHERALQAVQEADVCVSPFYPNPILDSTSPTKLVEYLALGRPVVANDHPEQRLVIGASGGGYCVPWDEQAFADAIVALLRDPASAARMGRQGREYVLEHRVYARIADAVEAQLRAIAAR